MKHEQLLQQGKLTECLYSIQGTIRSEPGEIKHRIFLFQLLAILGSWERATKQLDVIAKLDDGALAMVHTYRAVIQCEVFREAVFSGDKEPVFMGEPEEWQALMIQALKLGTEGHYAKSQGLRNKAFELAPTSSGSINNETFEWLADADSRLGPLLEVIIDGRYLWVPYSNILRLKIEEPEDLRDSVWMPAHIQWQTEGESFVLIPTRYPFSEKQGELLALSRKTEWEALLGVNTDDSTDKSADENAEMYIGYGQRQLVTDAADYSLMDIRDVLFEPTLAVTSDEEK